MRPTLEIVLTELPRHFHRRSDSESGLALIDLTPASRSLGDRSTPITANGTSPEIARSA